MAKTAMKIKQRRTPKFSTQSFTHAAESADVRIPVLKNTASAVYASVSWLTGQIPKSFLW